MMGIEIFLIIGVLSLILLVIVSLAFVLIKRLEQRLDGMKKRLSEQETSVLSLRGAVSALYDDAQQVTRRQNRIEQQLRQIGDQQEQLLLRDPDTGPYRQAMHLAKKGASVEDLVTTCGLNRGEAELLLSLYRAKTTPPNDAADNT